MTPDEKAAKLKALKLEKLQSELEQAKRNQSRYGTVPQMQDNSVETLPSGETVSTQEQYPGVAGSRFLTKNLAQSNPQVTADYVMQAHPDLEAKDIGNGRIAIRKKGEKNWPGVLDPDRMDLQDISDVIGDVVQGAGSTAASAMAGLAAAPSGPGAIPAAMAAGGATNAGLEHLKQRLGQALGIKNNINHMDTGVAGVTGLLAPLLAGTGAGSKQIAAKAIETGMAPEALAASQRGLVKRGYDALTRKALPTAMEWTSGVPKEATQALIERHPEVTSGAVDDLALAKQAQASVVEPIQAEKRNAWKQLENALLDAEARGDTVSMKNAKAALDSHIAELEHLHTQAPTEAIASELEGAKALRDSHFAGLPDELPPTVAQHYEQKLKTPAMTYKSPEGTGAKYAPAMPVEDKALASAAEQARMETTNELKKLPGVADAKSRYADVTDLADALKQKFSTPENTVKSLKNLDAENNRLLRERIKQGVEKGQVSPEVYDNVNVLRGRAFYQDPSLMPLSRGSATSTSKTISGPALGGALGFTLGGPIGGAAGAAAGGAMTSPYANRKIIELMLGAEKLGAKIPKSTWLNILNSSSNMGTEQLEGQ